MTTEGKLTKFRISWDEARNLAIYFAQQAILFDKKQTFFTQGEMMESNGERFGPVSCYTCGKKMPQYERLHFYCKDCDLKIPEISFVDLREKPEREFIHCSHCGTCECHGAKEEKPDPVEVVKDWLNTSCGDSLKETAEFLLAAGLDITRLK